MMLPPLMIRQLYSFVVSSSFSFFSSNSFCLDGEGSLFIDGTATSGVDSITVCVEDSSIDIETSGVLISCEATEVITGETSEHSQGVLSSDNFSMDPFAEFDFLRVKEGFS